MPVPQAPRFGAEPGDNQGAPSQATIEQVEALFEEPTTQPVQLAWGQTMVGHGPDRQRLVFPGQEGTAYPANSSA